MNKFRHSKTSNFMLILLFVAMLAFPNGFSLYKITILALVLGLIALAVIRKEIKIIDSGTVSFYFLFSLISSFWILWGLTNGGYEEAFFDIFKLYVFYSPIFYILVVTLQNGRYLDLMFRSFYISAWIIVFVNLTSLSEVFFRFQLFPDWFRDEMYIGVGIHEGYTDVSANNINSLFFIMPIIYIMAIAKHRSNNYARLKIWGILILSIFVALISGRRALIMLLFIVPILFEIQKRIVLAKNKHEVITVRCLPVIILMGFPFIVVGSLYYIDIIDITSLIAKFSAAFESDSLRAEQYISLLKGFSDNYLIGSGFGHSVDVIRSKEKPWIYELTYLQLLFNGGLIGSSLVFTLFGVYYIKALLAIRRFDGYKTEALAILTGFLIFCIAASSNPYFSSFDTLFLLGTFPLLSGWHAYFKKSAPKMNLPKQCYLPTVQK